MRHEIKFDTPEGILVLPYTVVKGNRKTIGIEVKPGGEILVRIPKYLPMHELDRFMYERQEWVYKAYQNQKNKVSMSEAKKEEKSDPRLVFLEKKYREAAKRYLDERVAYYTDITGSYYAGIRIADQKTRWGSCSSNKTLSFSWRLMLAPPRIADYVVIHEVCHLRHMNHSKEFWNMVESLDPDYKEHRRWLKENGNTLILK